MTIKLVLFQYDIGVVIFGRLNYIKLPLGELGAIFGRSSDGYVDRMS